MPCKDCAWADWGAMVMNRVSIDKMKFRAATTLVRLSTDILLSKKRYLSNLNVNTRYSASIDAGQ